MKKPKVSNPMYLHMHNDQLFVVREKNAYANGGELIPLEGILVTEQQLHTPFNKGVHKDDPQSCSCRVELLHNCTESIRDANQKAQQPWTATFRVTIGLREVNAILRECNLPLLQLTKDVTVTVTPGQGEFYTPEKKAEKIASEINKIHDSLVTNTAFEVEVTEVKPKI